MNSSATTITATTSTSKNKSIGELPSGFGQNLQRSKPVKEFTQREQNFIKQALSSEYDPYFTGTKVTLLEREEGDNLSMYSKDENNYLEGAGTSRNTNPQKKQRFKNMAKKLYPAKMVGGARVVGVAFRHPMVATRKMNGFKFMRRQSKNQGTPVEETSPLADWMPPLARSATMTNLHAGLREKENNGAGTSPSIYH
jgi:hypothetical protein